MMGLLLIGLVLLSLLPLVWPLMRRARPVPERSQYDRAVYRDQLRELEREVARGVVRESDAEAARLEIQRRLLAVDSVVTVRSWAEHSPLLASVVALFVTGGAVGLYEELGAPRVSDVVFKAPPATASAVPGGAVAARHADLARAADHLADKLKADPSNGELWLLFARISSRLRHVDTAVDAYRHALALGMDDPQVQVGLGEVLVLQADGIVTPAAQDAFKVVVKADPKDAVARYYLALAVGQAGKAEAAIGLMQGLLADIPEDAPLRDQIIRRIGELARASGVAMPAVAKGVPAVEPSRAAEAKGSAAPVAQGAQTAMVTAMVSKLAARLEVEPEDFDGWMQLGRGYAVLRETDKAADAYERAVALVPGDVASRLQAVEGLLAGVKPDDPVPPRVVALLRQVEAISPDEPEVLWYLGVVAAQDGRTGAARRYWDRLLARLPIEGENTEMVKAAMAGLKGG